MPTTSPRAPLLIDLLEQGQHVATVCNACRYCEAYCPAFQALETRRRFDAADLVYLANLCHNCGECLYACQYAPPHEFGINVPKTFSAIRLASYEAVSWPRPLGIGYRRYALFTSLSLVVTLIAVMTLANTASTPAGPRGDFYQVLPHDVMIGLFGGVFLLATIAVIAGVIRAWRAMTPDAPLRVEPFAVMVALRDALTLRHLHSGDPRIDCTDAQEQRAPWRRWLHHCTLYGFLFCFLSTATAAIYHSVFGWRAPYPIGSLPVVLGTIGGIGLIVGPLGLLLLGRHRDPALADRTSRGLDVAFTLLLLATSTTGLLLLAWRNSAQMPWLLVVHLACVLALFATMPYGKFVHGLLRTAALVRFVLESAHADADSSR
jgi:citrate/tricarballylate utilization protein